MVDRFTAVLAAAWLVGACANPPSIPTSAFSLPIDFTFACEGANGTTAPAYSGTGASEQWCSELIRKPVGGEAVNTQGALLGMVLNQDPPGVLVVSMVPGSSSDGGVVDTDPFVPGFTPIPVGANPIRILRASDYGAFYVLSAGSRTVTKIVVKSVASVMPPCDEVTAQPGDTPGCYESTSFDLPDVPTDGAIFGDQLIVSAERSNEAWVFDLTQDDPPFTTVALPGRLAQVQPLADGRLVATWVERGVVSLLDSDLSILAEAGVVGACADGLDNDGDGLADDVDPDCTGATDDDEAAAPAVPAVAVTEPMAPYTAGTDFCNDGVDNDGNGLTDAAEEGERCASDPNGEAVFECGDGIDNDGDGLTDVADTSCYSAFGAHEGAVGPFGYYELAVVDAGTSGRFAYVADTQRGRIGVFEVGDNTANTLERVDVWAHSAVAPGAEVRNTSTGSVTTVPDLVTTAAPELMYAGIEDLIVVGYNPASMLAAPVRGEVWDRAVPNDVIPAGASYSPTFCLTSNASECERPAGDDDTWYVFTPALNGALRMVQSLVRGVPRHRYAQSTLNPEGRTWKFGGRPSLTLRGRAQSLGSIPPRFAFMGPLDADEEITPAVSDERPKRSRAYGVYPPEIDDFERVTTQAWSITYEGIIPNTIGKLGRLTSATTFYAPGQRFCERGVSPGDWLVILAPREASPPAIDYDIVLETEDGAVCATETPTLSLIEAQVTTVGMDTLEVDPTTARLVPVEPQLDEPTIRQSETNILNACQRALETLRDEKLMVPGDGNFDFIEASSVFDPANLPSRVNYEVRVNSEWTVVGSRAGFMHRNRWDGTSCVEDESLTDRFGEDAALINGRLQTEVFAEYPFITCPIDEDLVSLANMESLVDRTSAFENFSFSVHMLPGCVTAADGTVQQAVDRRDTRWSFSITSPDAPDTSELGEASFTRRLGAMEIARAIVYLDTNANRMRLLRYWHGQNTGQSYSRLFD